MVAALFRLAPPGYRDVCAAHWLRALSGAHDPVAVRLMRSHYSRRKPNSAQFMPPGNRIALVSRAFDAVWGWWRPDPASGLMHRSGYNGWWCTAFHNEGAVLSSELILDAELALSSIVDDDCGPDGLLTYVDPRKVKSRHPGRCFKAAGWRLVCTSSKGLLLFQKPYFPKLLSIARSSQGGAG